MRFPADDASAATTAIDVRRSETSADLAVAHTILADAARRQIEHGAASWLEDDFFALDEAAARGDLYLATVAGDAAACLILQWSDPRFWGERPADAAYLHKLAVRRQYAGRGIGRRLLDWAAEQTVIAGRVYLRLDCQRDNATLNDYYRAAGFIFCGEHREGPRAWSLYEKPLPRPHGASE